MSAKFFFYPQPNGSFLRVIDLGEDLGELFSDFEVDAVDGRSFDGGIYRNVGRSGEIVTIQRDRLLLGEDLARKFVSLQNHLDRGFSCAFTSDHTKAWAAPLKGKPSGNSTKLFCYGNPFKNAVGSNIPSADDYIVIETAPPAMLHEIQKVDSVSLSSGAGGSIILDSGVDFHYRGGPLVFARYYRFWPVLKRPASDIGQSIITNEGGRLFSLSLRLVPDYSTLFSYHPEISYNDHSPTDNLGTENTPSDSDGGPRGGIDSGPKGTGTFDPPDTKKVPGLAISENETNSYQFGNGF